MWIKTLRIGHFGKFHNVEISLENGLNLVTGGNESGKTTIYAFIGAMLFGLERKRGRAGREDPYQRYKPWDTPGAYQGSMDFVHDGHEYRIVRVFYQKEKSCTLTDLTIGKQLELADDSITSLIPQLTYSAYYNSVSMGQKALRSSSDFGDEVQNYIANLAMTGGSRVNVSAALDELAGRKKTFEAERKRLEVTELTVKREELLSAERKSGELAFNRGMLLTDLKEAEAEALRIKEAYPDVEAAYISWQQAREAADEALDELCDTGFEPTGTRAEAQREQGAKGGSVLSKKADRLRNSGMLILAIGLLLCIIGNERSIPLIGTGICAAVAGLILLLLMLIMRIETSRGTAKEEVSETDYREKCDTLDKAAEALDKAGRIREELLAEERELNQRINEISSALDRAEWELSRLGDIGSELEECECEIERRKKRIEEIDTELEAIRLASETIETLTDSMYERFTNSFNDILSEEICLATDGRYSGGIVNDDFNIEVMGSLDYVPAEALSGGTCEQLYTALRFAVARLMFSDTEVPVLMDECFAYSDDNRLRSALSAIADRENGQIILFSCGERERRTLDTLGAEYRLIELDKCI